MKGGSENNQDEGEWKLWEGKVKGRLKVNLKPVDIEKEKRSKKGKVNEGRSEIVVTLWRGFPFFSSPCYKRHLHLSQIKEEVRSVPSLPLFFLLPNNISKSIIVLWGEKFCTSLRDGPFSKFGLELTLTFMEQILHKSRVEAIPYLCDINTHKSCLDSPDFMGRGSPTSWSKILI